MRVICCSIVMGLMGQLAFAIDFGESMSKLGAGTKLVALADIQIPANTDEIRVSSHCALLVSQSVKSRIWKRGQSLEVSRGRVVSYPTFDSSSDLLELNNRDLSGVRCGSPAGWSRFAYEGLTYGEFIKDVAGSIKIFEADPTPIEAGSICKGE